MNLRVLRHGLSDGPVALPRNLTRDPARVTFVIAASGLLSLLMVGLPAAIFGFFTPWVVLPATLVLWWALGSFGLRITKAHYTRTSQVTSALALFVALAFGLFAASHSSEHLLTNRDPGVYVTTGTWLADHGDLFYDPGLPADITLTSSTRWPQGVHDAGTGVGYFQFQHSLGVVLATAQWLGGDWLMFRTMSAVAAIGLLGIYLAGRRMAGPTLGLLPVAATALHPAFVHVAKDAYSESLALVFAMGAFWVWLETRRNRSSGAYFACGLLLGAGSLARIDGWITGIGFMAGLVYLIVTGGERAMIKRREVAWLVLGFLCTAGLSLIDLTTRSPVYFGDLAEQAVPMIAVFVVVSAITIMTAASPGSHLRRLGRHIQKLAPSTAAVALASAGIYGFFIRPRTTVTRYGGSTALVAGLQEREGLEIDSARTYAESSLEWLARYQGNLSVIFGIVAVSIASYLILRRTGDRRTPVLAAALAVMMVYLWQPSITPDHFWAMRRFVPVVLPLGFVLTALAARQMLRMSRGRAWVEVALAGTLAVSVSHSVAVGWPVAAIRTQVGVNAAIQEVCGLLPENAVVLYERRSQTLAGALRTRCDVPTTSAHENRIVEAVLAAGLTPVMVSSDVDCSPTDLGSVETTFEFPERTLTIPPQRAETGTLVMSLAIATNSEGPHLSAPDPEAADASLLVEVETTWAPEGYSMIASIGGYTEGMWLQYGPTGIVELWITTDEGHFGIPASPSITDGVPRVVGGYFLDGVLYATCGGQRFASTPAPGDPVFQHDDVELTPAVDGASEMQTFEGMATLYRAEVDRALLGGS